MFAQKMRNVKKRSLQGLSSLLLLSSSFFTSSQGGIAGWCGSGDDRCTAYPAYADTYGSYCAVDDVYKFVGSDKGVGVWQSNGASDFWRIHSCDGMGLMFDVQDASFYMEHMDGADQGSPHYNDCSWIWNENCFGSDDEYNKCAACMHTQSTFVHPGTSQTFSNYWAGQWTFCDAKWPDDVAGKLWFPEMQSQGLKDPKEYGCHDAAATLYVILYPWVCNYNSKGQDGSELWGDDNNWANGLPWGNSDTYNVDCYYGALSPSLTSTSSIRSNPHCPHPRISLSHIHSLNVSHTYAHTQITSLGMRLTSKITTILILRVISRLLCIRFTNLSN